MSRLKTDLKPAAMKKGLASPRKSTTRFPSVSARAISTSPRHSIDTTPTENDNVEVKSWTVDMVRGVNIPAPARKEPAERSQKNTQVTGNKNSETNRSNSKDAEKMQKYLSLQKLINQLREEIKVKNKTIAEMQAQLKKNDAEYGQKLKELKDTIAKHEQMIETFYEEIKGLKESISERNKEMDVVKQELEVTKVECDEKVESIVKKTDEQITAIKQQHKDELNERDAKLSFLKTQLESALKSNSKERQRQLEELTKELNRVTDETETLKAKLRALAKQKQGDETCQNCRTLEDALHTKLKEIREKDGTIVELLHHCQKMAIQLSRQDEFVKLLEENKLKLG